MENKSIIISEIGINKKLRSQIMRNLYFKH